LQFDEKWAFVFKKRQHCSEEELAQERVGDCWDHLGFDPEHRLVLSVVFGPRIGPNVHAVVQQVKKQLAGRVPSLITTDGYSTYAEAFARAFSFMLQPKHQRGQPNPGGPKRQLLAGLNYAIVEKRREHGRVVEVTPQIVYGTEASLQAALKRSRVSSQVNTSFVERHNATDRHRNARKARRTYRFSKDWDVHAAVGYFTLYSYNFCWPVSTLRLREGQGKNRRWRQRTPAMSAGLTDHIWTLCEWLSLPAGRDAS